MKNSTRVCCVVAALIFVSAVVAFYLYKARAPKNERRSVAAVGFFATDVATMRDACAKNDLDLTAFSREEFLAAPPKRYDVILLRTIGMRLEDDTPELRERLDASGAVAPFPAINELYDRFARVPDAFDHKVVDDYLTTITAHNADAFMAAVKRDIFAMPDVEVPAPEALPNRGFFYTGFDVQPTYEEWLKREDVPRLPEDAPRVALVGPFLNPFKAAPDSAPLVAIVEAFARRGIRAVPFYGFRSDPGAIERLKPELIVAFPLGALLPASSSESGSIRSRRKKGDDAEKSERGSRAMEERARMADKYAVENPYASADEFLTKTDVPVLTAISLSTSSREWLTQPVGMTTTYQNLAVALPELDGAIESTPVSSLEPNENGEEFRTPIVDRVERMADRAARWIALRHKPNSEKKIAIIYHRGPGAAPITAQSLEALPSLYNVLLKMREEGYDLGDEFPDTIEEFAQIVDKRGRTIGQWAPGAFRKFVDEAEPERVDSAMFNAWAEKDLSQYLRDEAKRVWGPTPGVYFTMQNDAGGSFIVVSRVRFGNVVVMPQPTTAIIDDDPKADDFSSVHGTNKAIPYYYQAAYLWIREGFQADAVLNFGTHGALEFTRGKSLILSERCWPDALIGDLPNVYLYSVNNVGEGLLARRRIRATLVTHTTPPFMNADVDEYAALEKLLDALDGLEDDQLREQYVADIENEVEADNLTEYDPPNAEDRDNVEKRAEFYREQLRRLRETSVTDGLHIVGKQWTDEQITNTAAAVGGEKAEADLRASVGGLEMERLIAALNGRFIPASTGGDPIVNPESLPTGRDMAGLNIEQTPDESTFKLAWKMTEEDIANYVAKNGRYPRRLAFTFWGGEYIRTRGLALAQALCALGVRPVFDARGILRDIEVVPSEELARPRVDVVAQTSGQFRDAAPSRIELLDRAARMVAALDDEALPNYVKEHTRELEKTLRGQGYVEDEARELATARIFGSTHALDYGTGIRSLVERSDRWKTRSEIADQYLLNMGGIYRNGKVWGAPIKGLFEENLRDVDVVLQSRSSNVWGPVKLDHMYEFGTVAAVVREKGGADPEYLLSDARKKGAERTQALDEAIRDELQTTMWNKKWLENAIRDGGAGTAAALAKSTQNLFGWSAVGKEGLIDDATWKRTFDVVVDDSLDIGMREYFEENSPASLAETTAVMLDAARKNFWNASQEDLEKLAKVHAEVVQKYGAPCSYNVCGNKELREYIVAGLPEVDAAAYQATLDEATTDPMDRADVNGMELVEVKQDAADETARETELAIDPEYMKLRGYVLLFGLLLFVYGFLSNRRRY